MFAQRSGSLRLPSLAVHADWSIDARKRWMARARRTRAGWRVMAPEPVGEVAGFLARLLAAADGGAVALGLDLPIGVPRAYAMRRAEQGFLHFLRVTAGWPDFFQVCATLQEIRADRPFYPARGVLGMTRAAHAEALGLGGPMGLSRACDRADRRAAGRRAAVLDAWGRTSPARQRSPPGATCCCPRCWRTDRSACGRSRARSATCWRPGWLPWPKPIPPRRCGIWGSA